MPRRMGIPIAFRQSGESELKAVFLASKIKDLKTTAVRVETKPP